MVEVREQGAVVDTLRLALDLCLGLGAFVAGLTGAVQTVVSESMPPEDGSRRIERLARRCLVHPAAKGSELFWNAEVPTETEPADCSLACVVVPVWAGDVQAGLLGVVDVWLPEPDDGQRAGLEALAGTLAEMARAGPLVQAGDSSRHVDGSVTSRHCPLPPGAEGDLDMSLPALPALPAPLTPPTLPAPPAVQCWAARTPHPVTVQAADPAMDPLPGPGSSRSGNRRPVPLLGRTAVGAEPFLRCVLDHLPDAVLVTRGDGTIMLANDRFAHMVGRGADELVGSDVRVVVAARPGDMPRATLEGGGGWQHPPARRLVVRSASGEQVPVTAIDVRIDDAGAPVEHGDRFVTVLRPAPAGGGCAAVAHIDCVDLVGNLDDGVLCLDGAGTVVLANQAADRFHGVAPGGTLLGAPLPETSGLRTEDGQPLVGDAHPGIRALHDGTACTARLVLGSEGDGQQHVTVMARPFPVDGHRGALVVLHDSTTEWLEQRRLTQYALYDPLTGLANRYLLVEELRRMLLLLGRQGGAVALVYLDLDGFKRINDEFGHDTGDEVLAAVARRLRGAVRSDDVVARLGGDEFVIAHASAERLPDGDLVVSRLRKVLSAPFRVRSQVFDVGASIGWVSTDRGEEGPDVMLAQADRAMYLQKRNRAAARREPA